jgi:exopolyphosphatase/guanosine-5'-triphosphate,3'-diphosphate pyrophosphatase
MPTVRVAVFDLGSSSFHLMVVDATRDGVLTPVLRRRSFLHLGTEVARTGGVPADRAASAVRTVRRLRLAADEAGVDVVVALATAALRDAANGSRLLSRLEQVLGSSITLLTGEEEARLCFLGQRAGVWVGKDPVLGLDLGGGSLEAGIGNIHEVSAVTSVALGTARLRGELGTGEVLTPADRVAVTEVALARAAPIRAMLSANPQAGSRVIASGGTVRALARLAMGLHRPLSGSVSMSSLRVNQVELPAGQLHELADRLATLDLDARLALPGVQTRRAPLLPIGAVVLSTLVESLGLQRGERVGTTRGRRHRRPLASGRSATTVERECSRIVTGGPGVAAGRCCSGLFSEDPVHSRSTGWALALGRSTAVGHLDFFAFELPLLTALHAISLIRRHGSSS